MSKKYNIISLIFILFCLIFNSTRANSQTHYESRIFVGAHGGINLSRVTFTPSVTQNFNIGANAGVNFRYIEENHFGFILEANFEQRGWDEDFEEYPYKYSRTVNFIQIPFLAHIYFGRRGKFYINAGPSISLKLNEFTSSNFDYSDASKIKGFPNRITYQYSEPAKKFDYGISGGIGGEFNVNTHNSIYLEGRFYYGLADLLKSGRTEPLRGSNPMSISLSLGYWFRIK